MTLGCFSLSLSVKDLATSKQFYENLGFTVFAGEMEHNFLIMKNGETNIGLFQGMFEGNMMTFNPGWDNNAQSKESFQDVREWLAVCKEKGMTVTSESINTDQGPANFSIVDPDGNTILFDQHV